MCSWKIKSLFFHQSYLLHLSSLFSNKLDSIPNKDICPFSCVTNLSPKQLLIQYRVNLVRSYSRTPMSVSMQSWQIMLQQPFPFLLLIHIARGLVFPIKNTVNIPLLIDRPNVSGLPIAFFGKLLNFILQSHHSCFLELKVPLVLVTWISFHSSSLLSHVYLQQETVSSC